MGRKILMIFLLGLFWIGFISAIDCRPQIKTEIGIYDKVQEGNKFIFERSKYQINNEKFIVEEGNYLLIESFSFSINNSCNIEERVVIELKNPEEEGFSSIAYIPLKNSWEEDGLIKYSFDLIDLAVSNLNTHKDSQGNLINCCAPKRLNIEGKWATKVLYGEIQMHLTLFNEGSYLYELDVRDRLFLAQLETLQHLRDDSDKSSGRSLKVVFLIGLSTIILEAVAILEMKKHYRRRTKEEDEREEERQFGLLESLYSELVALESDLISYKKDVLPNLSWFTTQNTWEISSPLYVGGLNREIKKIKTKSLKQNIIDINKKTIIINNQMILINNRSIPNTKASRDNILNITKEALFLIENSKKFMEKNFKVSL